MAGELRKRFNRDVEVVKTVLREWDPIGVFPNWKDSPARDEYDSYAPQVLSLLYAGDSLEEVADHLERLRTGDMGMPSNRQRDLEVASKLLALHLLRKPE